MILHPTIALGDLALMGSSHISASRKHAHPKTVTREAWIWDGTCEERSESRQRVGMRAGELWGWFGMK